MSKQQVNFMQIRCYVAQPFKAGKTKPFGQIQTPTWLAVLAVVLLLACILLIGAVVMLSMPKRKPQRTLSHGAHADSNSRRTWHQRISGIVQDHADGKMDREEALDTLAQVARDFASMQTGRDLSSRTLLDIGSEPHTQDTSHGMGLLKVTINALYPPQFADTNSYSHPNEASVEQAGEWVSDLVDRWH